jgi:2-keto-4-pentenoate hydratase/2-oxohepta-3-ene-1,7-dioic acid hydratase in catechol pathway
MRIGRYQTQTDDTAWSGAVIDDETVVRLSEAGRAADVEIPESTVGLLETPDWHARATRALDRAAETGAGCHDIDTVVHAAPVATPGKVVCVGRNYRAHAAEGGNVAPDAPVLFSKFRSSIEGPGATVSWDPNYATQVDYEAELVVVIGEQTRDVDPEDAMGHVAGYLVGNDITARDLQTADGQWIRGKNLEGFAPIGPELVTAEEVADPHDLAIYTEIDGERLQDASTAQLVFGVDELIAFCSRAFPLAPGDLLFTGTPEGVGIHRDPPVLLGDGDTVTVGVEGLGELVTHCSHD